MPDVDHRLARAADREIIDADVVGLQRQWRLDAWQHLRPFRQFEGLVVLGEIERGAFYIQRIEPQFALQQRADARIQRQLLRSEGSVAAILAGGERRIDRAIVIGAGRPGEPHVAEDERPLRRPLRRCPGKRGIGRQHRHDPRQQRVAPADGGEQPPQQGQHEHDDDQRHQPAAQGQLALAAATQLLELGQARLALLGRGIRRQRVQPITAIARVTLAQAWARAHRSAPSPM